MSLENRRERVHQREVSELRRIIELRDQEKKKLEEELSAVKERARVREAEFTAPTAEVQQVDELRSQVEQLRQDLVLRNQEVTRRDSDLVVRTRELGECKEKLIRMGHLCRRRMKRALEEQLALFRESCEEQSQNAVDKVQGYLQARGSWETADRLLSETKGAMQVLTGLKNDGVPIPDKTFASLVVEEAKCIKKCAASEVQGLSSDDFDFDIPSNLGIPNLEEIRWDSEDKDEGPSEEEEADRGEGDPSEVGGNLPFVVRAESRSTEETGLLPSGNLRDKIVDGRSGTPVTGLGE